MEDFLWYTAAITVFFFVSTLRVCICAFRKKPQDERCWFERGMLLFYLAFMTLMGIDLHGWQEKWLLQIAMLTFDVINAIFQWKICMGASVRDMIDKLFREMYSSRCDVRSLYARLSSMDSIRKRKYKILYFGLWLVIVGISLWMNAPLIALASFTLIFFGAFFIGIHSLRRFLFIWFLESIAIIGITIMVKDSLLPQLMPSSDSFVTVIGIYSLLLMIAWINAINAADHNVGRLAALTVNTYTTVILIIVNVCAISADLGGFLFSLSREFWTILQSICTFWLMPFVVAGYLAALVKEFMIYWEAKNPRLVSEIEQKTGRSSEENA